MVGKGKFFYMYGLFESMVFVMYYLVDELEEDILFVLIGKLVSNMEVYIFDWVGYVQFVGIVGEFCVSGEGFVKGYYNCLELIEEKFILYLFMFGECMYKMGDFVRWLLNGDIEFIGWIDYQVKICGQCIEFGEIEYQL